MQQLKSTRHGRLSMVALSALCAFLIPTTHASDEEVDVFGYYFLQGEIPQLKEIDHLHLSTVEYKDDQEVKVPLYGFIRFKDKGAEDAHLISPTLKGNEFTFTTKAVGGISYEFSGKFLKLGNFPVTRPEGEVLSGHLTKLEAGKKVFEQDVTFTYTGGD